MAEQHLFRTSVQWQEQNKGTLSSPDLPQIAVATPPEFPGGHKGFWSPETLYVASAEACLMSTFLAIAGNSKLEFSSYSSDAEGVVEKTDVGFQVIEIRIHAKVTIPDESRRDRALRILEKAEKYCLISNSMKTKVTLDPEIAIG
ncbi:MAG TPA: OsmC family protein [Spirochaetia bacterium]|nr:OsmC family protein [Spirochaetia bacterium]